MRGCVCGGGGSRYLGCVSGGVATVISLGIWSSLGFRIRFRVGIRCCTPDTRPGCCGPVCACSHSRASARSGAHALVCRSGGGGRGNVFSGCSEPWFSGIRASPLSGCWWVLGSLGFAAWVFGTLGLRYSG